MNYFWIGKIREPGGASVHGGLATIGGHRAHRRRGSWPTSGAEAHRWNTGRKRETRESSPWCRTQRGAWDLASDDDEWRWQIKLNGREIRARMEWADARNGSGGKLVCSWALFIGPGWPAELVEVGRRRRPVVALNSSVLFVSRVKTTPKGRGNRGGGTRRQSWVDAAAWAGWSEAVAWLRRRPKVSAALALGGRRR
jgi:hypothetical protein